MTERYNEVYEAEYRESRIWASKQPSPGPAVRIRVRHRLYDLRQNGEGNWPFAKEQRKDGSRMDLGFNDDHYYDFSVEIDERDLTG